MFCFLELPSLFLIPLYLFVEGGSSVFSSMVIVPTNSLQIFFEPIYKKSKGLVDLSWHFSPMVQLWFLPWALFDSVLSCISILEVGCIQWARLYKVWHVCLMLRAPRAPSPKLHLRRHLQFLTKILVLGWSKIKFSGAV